MPTYEYRCEECGRTFDVVQSFADAPLTTCEVCGGALRKVYAPVGIVFKGSGFYKTDSRTSSSKHVGASAKDSKDSKDSKETKESTGTTDSKDSKVATSPGDGGSNGSAPSAPVASAPAASSAPSKVD